MVPMVICEHILSHIPCLSMVVSKKWELPTAMYNDFMIARGGAKWYGVSRLYT